MVNMGWKAATLATGAAILAVSASPAEARRYYHRDRDRTGTAIVAGIAGLAIGAAIASSSRDRYRYRDRYYDDGYYYDRSPRYDRDYYYDRPYPRYRGDYYDRPYRYRGGYGCTTRRVYDPYLDRRVRVRYCG